MPSTRQLIQEAADQAIARELARNGEGRTRRARAGLSQAAVGTICGVSGPAISRWEKGDRAPRGRAAVRYLRLMETLGAAPEDST